MRFGRSPGQFVELFDEALGHMLKGEDEAVILDATCHAHVYGRPTGAWAFEEIARNLPVAAISLSPPARNARSTAAVKFWFICSSCSVVYAPT